MKHEAIGLFSQPLVKTDINIDGVAEFFDSNVRGNGETFHQLREYVKCDTLKHYHNETNVFKIYPELKPLGDRILEYANFVYQDVLNHDTSLLFTNAWFNECGVGGMQGVHNHSNSLISGTLYIRTDENTNIEFYSPFSHSNVVGNLVDNPNTGRPNKYGYAFHYDVAKIGVSDGVCLFWNSYLRHGYSDNKTEGRLSLSFNMLPETFNNLYKTF